MSITFDNWISIAGLVITIFFGMVGVIALVASLGGNHTKLIIKNLIKASVRAFGKFLTFIFALIATAVVLYGIFQPLGFVTRAEGIPTRLEIFTFAIQLIISLYILDLMFFNRWKRKVRAQYRKLVREGAKRKKLETNLPSS